MNIFQMSLRGSLLIVVILLLRHLLLKRLPKRSFLLLWALASFQLLVPVSFSSPFSIAQFVNEASASPLSLEPAETRLPVFMSEVMLDTMSPSNLEPSLLSLNTIWTLLWGIGTVFMSLILVFLYWQEYRLIKKAYPINQHSNISDWLQAQDLKRPLNILLCDELWTPIATGIFKPKIILSRNMDLNDEQQLHYILNHELVHLKHWDGLWKLGLIILLCVHWFNPLVWLMYFMFNRDLELACDEQVILKMGYEHRKGYALALIQMIEKSGNPLHFHNGFNKEKANERIDCIMKLKKNSTTHLMASFTLIIGIALVFATEQSIPQIEAQSMNENPQIPVIPIMDDVENEQWHNSKEVLEFEAFMQSFDGDIWEFFTYDSITRTTLFNDQVVDFYFDPWGETHSKFLALLPADYTGETVTVETVRNPETFEIEDLIIITEARRDEIMAQLDHTQWEWVLINFGFIDNPGAVHPLAVH